MEKSNFHSHNDYTGLYLFNETAANPPIDKTVIQSIASTIEQEQTCAFQLIEIVFVDESGIVAINEEHLERDYVTDIITFRYDEQPDNQAIEGTLYCCAPRIAEQAREHNEPVEEEFKRIIIHGMLHLIGYEDKSPDSKTVMRQKEEFFLGLI